MKSRRVVILASSVALVLLLLVIWLQPMLFFRSSYVATPKEKFKATVLGQWQMAITPEQMCREVVPVGFAEGYSGRLLYHYAHWTELLMHGKTPKTSTLICVFPDNHSTIYQRWDWRFNSAYEIEILWHGRRQRGDVNVPNTLF